MSLKEQVLDVELWVQPFHLTVKLAHVPIVRLDGDKNDKKWCIWEWNVGKMDKLGPDRFLEM